MTPYYQDDLVTIYHGDCREWMPEADVIVTDPPYGVGFRDAPWDVEHPDWWIGPARERFNTVVFTTTPTMLWRYPEPDWVGVWFRGGGAAKTRWNGYNHWSPIVGYGPVKFPVDVFRHWFIEAKQWHPTMKPVELMRWIVQGTRGSVLDPFMGSGSTLVAAKSLNRHAIGIEIEERYCEIAARRCSQEVLGLAV